MTSNKLFAAAILALCVDWAMGALSAEAQLRIVSYNTATAFPNSDLIGPRPGTSTVLEAIGAEVVGGIAKPIDVLLLQEQFTVESTTQSFVELLNDIYDPIERTMYARSNINGSSTSIDGTAGRPAMVYNTHTVEYHGELAFGSVGSSSSQQPRATLRYHLRPLGYGDSADFYVYNDHYKSDTGSVENARRLAEAKSVRFNADMLGEGAHVIYAGDFNIQSSSAASYQELLSSGNGQAFDPINMPGSWHNSSSLRITHTQAPTNSGPGTLVGGGMDDRFDFQLVTGEFLDAEGLSYIPNSYHAFGNNGTHVCCNSDLSSGTGASPAVLDALETASDHLPVVADYQLPAWLGASLATTLPSTVPLDSIFNLDVLVENLADVLTENGADELDYAISVSGDLIGTASGMDLALGGGNLHSLLLDTSTLGARSGTVVVSTTSQAAANPLIELPVEFFVGTPSADFDSDGDVDGRDLLAWQRNFGSTGGGDANYDGTVDADDLAVWEMQFGTAPSQGSQQVPEPASLVCFLFALVGSLATRPTRKILR